MRETGGVPQALRVEWSPGRVRVYDPLTRKLASGATILECAPACVGREAIVGVGQRSAFIRSVKVPASSKAEAAKILEFQVASLLPFDPKECAWGFRLSEKSAGGSRIAVLGAVKTETLRRIHAEAVEAGVKVAAVLPVAFGSWLAARERGIRDCAVVETDGGSVSIDLLQDGEIAYSRSIPMPDSPVELQSEVSRTFKIAGSSALPIFSTGCPGIHADQTYDREAIQYLSDSRTIEKLLFSLELPEREETRRARAEGWRARRALAALAVAAIFGIYTFAVRFPGAQSSNLLSTAEKSALKDARAKEASAMATLSRVQRANRFLDVAFSPGQSLSDVMAVLSGLASENSWFTNLTLVRGAPLSISGLALEDKGVAHLAAKVSESPRFEEMKVVSTNKATIGKRQVTQFLVLGKMKGLPAFDHPAKKGKGK